jgi:hypothetical protein
VLHFFFLIIVFPSSSSPNHSRNTYGNQKRGESKHIPISVQLSILPQLLELETIVDNQFTLLLSQLCPSLPSIINEQKVKHEREEANKPSTIIETKFSPQQ